MCQMSFINEIDRADDVKLSNLFEEYKPNMKKWHKFQDGCFTFGNDYYWWRSRFYDDNPTYVDGIYSKVNTAKQKMFPRLWMTYQGQFQRV